ncbi:hypothetical protein DFH94DRAFT_689910 [Russula ochroleuca]|uniref:MARVEL domain-containing protein n=1 Tax=Russula ochroleuca TaxID=152965 RepID=A0A9P5N0K4_9AGAM|nr:hypothetical protein DFH94DRAFT_689910 [Russula ochroleuca]
MPYSSVGMKVVLGYCVIIILNVVIFVLSARVNSFQDYYYIADIFPLALSAFTFGITALAFILDVGLDNSPTARAPFEVTSLFILSMLWLAVSAFSTSRWSHVPLNCSAIPADYSDVRSWCRELQVLKAFVWVNWVVLLLAALAVLRFFVVQHKSGQEGIWYFPLSRFTPRESRKRSEIAERRITPVWDFLRFSR